MKKSHPSSRRQRKGVALIFVLSMVVLVAAMLAMLLSRAGFERQATASYQNNAMTRVLSNNVVNLVQGQINDATKQENTTWASQPGAIRVYDNDGNLVRINRLYSSTGMFAADSSEVVTDVPADNAWRDEPSIWTDLNAPASVSGSLDANGNPYLVFPILDPRDPSQAPFDPDANPPLLNLDGFGVTNAPGATTMQPAPMPVRWLYVLEDGTMVSPAAGSDGKITVAGATRDNPIIGRIAYWTDDETTKVNINTAADGDFWDVPKFSYEDDRLTFALHQPTSGEYQRYPGHPATTSLRPIFESIGRYMGTYPSGTGTTSEFFSLLPRYNDDYGSKKGTLKATQGPTGKADRFYTSVGEMTFAMPESSGTRPQTGLSRQQLETAKFFLTAHSRAPDVTLFGTPRVSVWPVHENLAADPLSPYTNPFDRVAAFCSTYGDAHRYYFQRREARSQTEDYTGIARNQQLYAYLQNLTSRDIPGLPGGSLQGKYPDDRDQILTQIFDYIRTTNLQDGTLADVGNNSQYYQYTRQSGRGRGQVAPIKIESNGTQGFGRFFSLSEFGMIFVCTADGNGLAPNTANSAHDPRSVSNLSADTWLKSTDSGGGEIEVGKDYVEKSTSAGPFKANPTLANVHGDVKTALNPNQKRVQLMFLAEYMCPSAGYADIYPDMRIEVEGLENVRFGGVAPFPNSANGTIEGPKHQSIAGRIVGGTEAINTFVAQNNSAWGRVNGWSNPSADNRYPFVSNPVTVDSTSGQASFSTVGDITVKILLADENGDYVPVQTFTVNFPATSVPLPDLITYGAYVSNSITKWYVKEGGNEEDLINTASDWWGFDKRIAWAYTSPEEGPRQLIGSIIRTDVNPTKSLVPPPSPWQLDTSIAEFDYRWNSTSSDVVRTVMAKGGDPRTYAAREEVDSDTYFEPHPLYHDTNTKLAHSFHYPGSADSVAGAYIAGKLVPGATYYSAVPPDVPGDVSNLTESWDWDNGIPGLREGGYLNKPDEGNTRDVNGKEVPYYQGSGQVEDPNKTFYTPNRILPSAVMLGSLPTDLNANTPWRTLLYRPHADHPATAAGPPDHLFLDLFSMPVVEPYPISEPFSTAGRINMNYQIVPFHYIERSTGIRAVLENERVAQIPLTDSNKFNRGSYGGAELSGSAYKPLNLDDTSGTLRQLREVFDNGDIFRTPSEICEIFLVPEGESWASDSAAQAAWYGDDFAMVGDNTRERPYAHIYPRLTTQSNTFTVHYRVQALKQPPTVVGEWDETLGSVVADYRGSTTIERYLDPADETIPDYATDFTAEPLENFYRWRVVSNQQFAP